MNAFFILIIPFFVYSLSKSTVIVVSLDTSVAGVLSPLPDVPSTAYVTLQLAPVTRL